MIPRVILADELTGNLDYNSSKKIVELLKKLSEQGKTVIVATHDLSITREADVRIELSDGRVTGSGSAATAARPLISSQKKKGKKR